MRTRGLLCTAFLLAPLWWSPARAEYLALGKGVYGTVAGWRDIDWARFDWIVVTGLDVERLNRLLELNPRQQYVFSLRPHYHLGTGDYGQCTLLDYMYNPDSRQRLLDNLRAQIQTLLTRLRRPDHVRGFAFIEELPGHFADYKADSRSLETHRAAIERDTGRPLRWDRPLRVFLMDRYVAALREIHRTIREAAPGRLIFYWPHPNFGCLSFDPDEDAYPYRLEDIVRPGQPDGADGLVHYWRRPDVFQRQCGQFVKKYGWNYIVQVSYPSGMRLLPWQETLQGAFNHDPHNLGVYLFTGGEVRHERHGHLNDPELPAPADPRSRCWASHVRRYGHQQAIGNDVVQRYFRLHVRLEAVPKGRGHAFTASIAVTNPKEPDFYADPAQAVARDVRVTLQPLQNLWLGGEGQARLGDLAPGQTAVWSVPLSAQTTPQRLLVTATSADTDPDRREFELPVFLPQGQAQEVVAPEHAWLEPNWGTDELRPTIVLEGLQDPLPQPTLSDGTNTLVYRGELAAGLRLEIDPQGAGRLFPTVVYRDPALVDDPAKARPLAEGYVVGGAPVGKYMKSGAAGEVVISGRGRDGASSLVQLTYAPHGVQYLLHGAFDDTWRTVTARFTVPPGAFALERYHLFRYPAKGAVWYGRFEVRRADIPTGGIDVTDQLQGRRPVLAPCRLNQWVYRDGSAETPEARCRVQVRRP